jgi:hypothetical protein
LQVNIVKRKIQNSFPDLKVGVIGRSSKRDALQDIPLHIVEGRYEQRTFFGANKFAAVDKEDTRDIISYAAKNAKKWIDKMEY